MKRFALLTLGLLFAALSWAQVKVVYHLSEGVPQASRAIGNIRNHLNADPSAKIVVVTHGLGIDFLLQFCRVKAIAEIIYIGKGWEDPFERLRYGKMRFGHHF